LIGKGVRSVEESAALNGSRTGTEKGTAMETVPFPRISAWTVLCGEERCPLVLAQLVLNGAQVGLQVADVLLE
jgi:hypothetical protein